MSLPPERIRKLNDAGLGLPKGAVEFKSYNPRWKRFFSDEAYLIFDTLRIENLRLYHIGSTSIPDMPAKPVLDILGSVENLKALDDKKARLLNLGYECKEEYGIEGRRYFVLKNFDKSLSYIHLHLFEHGHPAIQKHLLFRDYLRLNLDAKNRYADLKINLASTHSRELYTENKAPLIEQLVMEAEKHFSKPKKVLAFLASAEGGHNTNRWLKELGPSYDSFEIVDLNNFLISPYNYKKLYPKEDQFISLIERILECDHALLASPVYWYTMAGPMKNFIDRFTDLLSGPEKESGEKLYGKKIELISTGYEEKMPMGFEVPFSCTALYFGMDYLGARYKVMRD